MKIKHYTLKEIVKKTRKNDGSFFAPYFIRPISRRISLMIYKTNIAPEIIVLLGTLIGILGGILFLLNLYWITLVAAILVYLSNVLDCVDGEIARISGKVTKKGALLDEYTDRLTDTIIYFCLGLVNYWIYNSYWIWIITFFAVAGNFIMVDLGLKINNLRDAKKVMNFYKKPLWRRAMQYGGDGNVLLIFIFALLNKTIIALVLIAIITNIYAVGRLIYQYSKFKQDEK
jgi:phosphatidylglycerophosphate synthase